MEAQPFDHLPPDLRLGQARFVAALEAAVDEAQRGALVGLLEAQADLGGLHAVPAALPALDEAAVTLDLDEGAAGREILAFGELPLGLPSLAGLRMSAPGDPRAAPLATPPLADFSRFGKGAEQTLGVDGKHRDGDDHAHLGRAHD